MPDDVATRLGIPGELHFDNDRQPLRVHQQDIEDSGIREADLPANERKHGFFRHRQKIGK
ncbi:hypothetical protein BE11_12305 [Sorangium cellulosum]|nr:hypothetical protein BE11_12305 [Sorangium cellulosum]